jgi:hypothetical protein
MVMRLTIAWLNARLRAWEKSLPKIEPPERVGFFADIPEGRGWR